MKHFIFPRRVGACTAVLGIMMMAYGIWRGEMQTVFTKAINICLECIGIG